MGKALKVIGSLLLVSCASATQAMEAEAGKTLRL